MIIDTLANAGRYAVLSGHFARAVRFLQETPPESLACGAIPIDGENVYATLQRNMTKTGAYQYEAHDRYADIQVVLQGTERFALGWDADADPPEPGTDFRRCRAEHCMDFVLGPGQYVIFLPGEAHAPGYAAGEAAPCLKLVIKVLCAVS